MNGIEQILRAGRPDVVTNEAGDVLARAVALLISFVQRCQGVGDHVGRCVRFIQQPHERADDQLVSQLAERLRHRRPEESVVEQRHQARRDTRIANARQGFDGRKSEKELAARRDLHEHGRRFCRGERTQRFNGVKLHVVIGIVEGADEGRHGAAVAALPKNQGRLSSQVHIRILQTGDERFDDVDLGGREKIEEAAENIEIAVLFAQRVHQRLDDQRRVLGEAVNRGPPPAPVVIGEGQAQGTGAARSSCPRCRHQPCPSLTMSAFHATGHVFDGHGDAGEAAVFPHRSDGDPLLHLLRRARWIRRWARYQIPVQRRREHFDGPAGCDALKNRQHSTLFELRHDRGDRAIQGMLRPDSCDLLEKPVPGTHHQIGVGREHAEERPGRRHGTRVSCRGTAGAGPLVP